MATVEDQVLELQNAVKKLAEDVSKEITNNRIKQIQTSVRLEALVRFLIEKQGFSFDEYIDFVDAYVKFSQKMDELSRVESLSDKITTSEDFNSTSVVKVYADDINVLPMVKQTGALSKTLQAQLLKLPHTNRFKTELENILKEDTPAAN